MKKVVPATLRAERLPQVYALLRRWYDDAILRPDERRFLTGDYDRWLARGRVTAEMAVELLLRRVRQLEYEAEDQSGDPVAEREHMIRLLLRRRALSASGLSASESDLLSELQLLQFHAARDGPPLLPGRTDEGLRVYDPESKRIASQFAAIRARYRREMDELLRLIDQAMESREVWRLPGRRPEGVIHLGERRRHQHELATFKSELGEAFLDPSSTMSYRASRVRKWKQLALREQRDGNPSKT